MLDDLLPVDFGLSWAEQVCHALRATASLLTHRTGLGSDLSPVRLISRITTFIGGGASSSCIAAALWHLVGILLEPLEKRLGVELFSVFLWRIERLLRELDGVETQRAIDAHVGRDVPHLSVSGADPVVVAQDQMQHLMGHDTTELLERGLLHEVGVHHYHATRGNAHGLEGMIRIQHPIRQLRAEEQEVRVNESEHLDGVLALLDDVIAW